MQEHLRWEVIVPNDKFHTFTSQQIDQQIIAVDGGNPSNPPILASPVWTSPHLQQWNKSWPLGRSWQEHKCILRARRFPSHQSQLWHRKKLLYMMSVVLMNDNYYLVVISMSVQVSSVSSFLLVDTWRDFIKILLRLDQFYIYIEIMHNYF